VTDIGEVSEGWESLEVADAAFMEPATVFAHLGTSESGLVESESSRRLHAVGPNAVVSHGARPLRVLL
jgi:Cation transporter/ATPase, N-terminus